VRVQLVECGLPGHLCCASQLILGFYLCEG